MQLLGIGRVMVFQKIVIGVKKVIFYCNMYKKPQKTQRRVVECYIEDFTQNTTLFLQILCVF